MKENNSNGCDRSSDLIAFLYHEADEREARDFQMHLRECEICSAEAESFGVVRESITAWRDEALAGFVSTPVTAVTPKKSALAAFRQFFDLSPLWLKGAAALALLTLCVLAGRAIVSSNSVPANALNNKPGAIYTQDDVDQIVQDALAKQELPKRPTEIPKSDILIKSPGPKYAGTRKSNEFAKSRRPLSRAEREQLAADLRLLSTDDDEPLYLLGDRINR